MIPYKQKYKLHERKQKFNKQIAVDKNKILIIVQKHKNSKLSQITPKFSCQKHYKFSMIKNMIVAKIRQKPVVQGSGNKSKQSQSIFVYVGQHIPKGQQSIQQIYNKYKDQDGFLYLTYQQMQSFGNSLQ